LAKVHLSLVIEAKVASPLVPFNTLVTSIIDRGGSLDGLRRGLMVKKVRLWLHVEGLTPSIPKRKVVMTG
jgi:hypothetical protein